MTNIVVGDIRSGLKTDRPPFLINNDAFPILNNAFVWRGRAKKKRGCSLLGRLQRNFVAQSLGVTTNGSGNYSGNLITLLSLETNASIVVSGFSLIIGADTFTDASGNGNLTGSTGGTGTINYSTGAFTISGGPISTAITATFGYNPCLPVMGIRQFNRNFTGASTPGNINYPLYVFFDTKYSYLYKGSTGPFYDCNYFYGSGVHFLWSGQNYQQFWTTNYQGAMWATNNKPGFNFVNGTYSAGSGTAAITFNFKSGGANLTTLIVNDVLWFNEWTSGGSTINGLTGTITDASGSAAGNYVVTFSGSQTVAGTGIAQLMTNTIAGQDGIKYFIGDPIGSPPSPDLTKGWVNFAPPLSSASAPSYLVGAKIIIPFKNRLLFFGTWTQTSAAASPTYNPNQLVACQNGTVFYANTGLPPNQTADVTSFYQNVVGKGLRLNAPLSQEIICVSQNNDVLIVILERQPLKLYSTGDDSAPFLYQTVSSEFGAQSTFSAIPLDSGVLSVGQYGFAITDQTSAQRIDLDIPDQVFNISQEDNGIERVCAVRDYREEFVYFTFPANAEIANNTDQLQWVFPTTTLAFNYRDNVWSTFTENYTSYGYFQYNDNYTWAQLGEKFKTWSGWTNPWNFGATQAKYPFVACGNQQGFVVLKQESTSEAQSQYFSGISISGTIVTITSPNHNLNDGDYIVIENAIGVTNLNGQVFKISTSASQTNTFTLLLTPTQTLPSGTYLGNGTYSRLTNFNVVTKQFPLAWGDSRQTRLGTQKYLFQKTQAGQVTVNLYVNETNTLIANTTEYSGYLPFSNVVLTCPEGNDLNLTQSAQDQIWHRLQSSVIGDVVQVEFTLSDEQMRDSDSYNAEFILYGFVLTVYPGPTLAF